MTPTSQSTTPSTLTGSEDKLSALAAMGYVELRVRDLRAEIEFYTRGVGLAPLWEKDGRIGLGLNGQEVVRLVHAPDLRPSPSNSAGLFHTAVLFSNPADLAASVVRTFRHYSERYVGAADHLVSEAFYFADPEGNGVELYHDRPREAWTWNDGLVAMDSLPLDPAAFVRQHLAENEAAVASVEQEVPRLDGGVGHVHLQVGDVSTAERFYVDLLGFDKSSTYDSAAIFVSAGGYHHHMAMNTWNSAGAGQRADGLGLGTVDILVPTREEISRLEDRLKGHGWDFTQDGQTLRVLDPWRNELRMAVGRATTL